MSQNSEWNIWMRNHVPGWRWLHWRWFFLSRWVRATIFRLRHGFDYRDTWSLDYAMAKWAAPRLRHLAKFSGGVPGTYGVSAEDIANREPQHWDPDHAQWVADINRCAKFFEDWVEFEDGDPGDNYQVESKRLHEEQKWVFTWMAEWWSGLWN